MNLKYKRNQKIKVEFRVVKVEDMGSRYCYTLIPINNGIFIDENYKIMLLGVKDENN